MLYLVDTNVLLRLVQRDDPQHQVIRKAFHIAAELFSMPA
jgi:predicted nucleic acid-binding protein